MKKWKRKRLLKLYAAEIGEIKRLKAQADEAARQANKAWDKQIREAYADQPSADKALALSRRADDFWAQYADALDVLRQDIEADRATPRRHRPLLQRGGIAPLASPTPRRAHTGAMAEMAEKAHHPECARWGKGRQEGREENGRDWNG